MKVMADYYQQFDADYSLSVPAQGFGGWQRAELELSPAHTAVVVMHAWDHGTPAAYPGWYRCVEYIPRAAAIARTVFPPLLAAVRATSLPLFHVVGGGDYYRELPGYRRAVALAGPNPPPPLGIPADPTFEALRAFRARAVHVGDHNRTDVNRGFAHVDFPPEARPCDDEYVAENGHQLAAVCREHGVNHLIYCGFAINWCLLLSPGGMAEMQRYGVLCSALRQATTAVENRESAATEMAKELGLWRVALAFGFVFDVPDFIAALAAITDR